MIPAVANAVYNAIGVRIDEIPITPDRVLKALAEKAKGRLPRVGPRSVPAFAFPPLIQVERPPEWTQS